MILGLDISTTCTAICALDDTGALMALEHVLTTKKGQTLYGKAEAVKNVLQGILESIDGPMQVYVEAPLQRAAGKSTAHTLFLLARYNGMICLLIHQMTGAIPIMVDATAARLAVGWAKPNLKGLSSHHRKKAIKSAVIDLALQKYTKEELGFKKTKHGNWHEWCGDRADAYVMALYGSQQIK